MGLKLLLALFVVSGALWLISLTPWTFLSEDAGGFVGGLAIGSGLGLIVGWYAERRGT